jgi:pimeloyl-ACP methyl ester carboxylesterase
MASAFETDEKERETTVSQGGVRTTSVVRNVRLPGRGECRVRLLNGPVSAPTVLLLHGWTATADLNWGRCYAALSNHFRVIAPDLRGHGRGVRGRFSLEACADDAAALLTVLGGGPAILVGYSMGGPIATLVWRRHPDVVAGLVLCSTAPYFAASAPESLFLSALSGCTGLALRLPRRAGKVLRALAIGAQAGVGTGLPQAALDVIGHHDPAAICEAAGSLLAYHAGGWLGSVSIPSSVVMTTRDHLVPPYRQAELARAIPCCALFSVDGDHAVCTTNPERFVPAVLAALGDVAKRALSSPLHTTGSEPMAA